MQQTYMGGKEKLKRTQHNDRIKNKFCIDNEIPLMRIPYWERENIKDILDGMLPYFGITDGTHNEKYINAFLASHPNWNYEDYIQIKNRLGR
ncbi:hypothetical protein WKH56_20705 [Priestia sp. SB1]|uniref:hypothetical protein n=1 Tax=Priestia sp. SB1 TaxID=3132359 RepID=UPI003177F6CB